MDKDAKQALQVAKEIVVKFIEVGRVTPTNFREIFPAVYGEVVRAIAENCEGSEKNAEKSGDDE